MDPNYINSVLQQFVLLAPGFLLGITVHEFTHGYVAYKLGDPTAKLAGRLTLNPISHLDLFGTILFLLAGIGWAKPVPVGPRYLQSPRKDMLWIRLGGPAANLILATLLAFVFHLIVFSYGGKNLGPTEIFILQPLVAIIRGAVRINVMLAIFNLLPVPPLDGSGIVAGLLPPRQAYEFEKLQPYGFIIFFVLYLTGVLSFVIIPPTNFITGLLLSGLG